MTRLNARTRDSQKETQTHGKTLRLRLLNELVLAIYRKFVVAV